MSEFFYDGFEQLLRLQSLVLLSREVQTMESENRHAEVYFNVPGRH